MFAVNPSRAERSIGQLGRRYPDGFLEPLLAIADRLNPSRIFRRLKEEARSNATIRELRLLNDYYLDDIGVRRSVDQKADDLVNRLRASRCGLVGAATLVAAGSLFCLASTKAAAGQYAQVSDDLALYYEEAGTGAPMILVPGWTASGVVFSRQIEHFSKSYHVVVYDPRSQGLSTRTLEHNDYAQHGRDLAGLIDKLGLKHVVLVAWSAGCFDGYSYVRAAGTDNLAAFVCIDMPPRGMSAQSGDWASSSSSDEDLAKVRKQLDALADNRRGLSQGMAKAMNARELSGDETDWFVRQAMLAPTYAMLSLRLDVLFSDYRPEAKLLDAKVPVLDVISEPNAYVALAWIKTNTPHTQTFTIKRHMSFWSEPESFNAGLDAFLEKVH